MDENGFLYFDEFHELRESSQKDHWDVVLKLQNVQRKPRNLSKEKHRLRTLLCHDMQGGYLPTESMKPCVPEASPYLLLHWWYVDVFCYFSHHLVTVPPMAWIKQAHEHDVLMLGTFITEFDPGLRKCEEMFSDRKEVDLLVERLVELCRRYHFDGWLINIENELKGDQLANMELFLVQLRQRQREVLGEHALVIWYDSVTENGELKWQNELNARNQRWFDVTDGIYLNYNWSKPLLENSLRLAGDRREDVYVGIDVFGRGCFGGGGWNCAEALRMIRLHGLSAAIFAPGWICEKFPDQCALANSTRFWDSFAGLVYPHELRTDSIWTCFSTGVYFYDGMFSLTRVGLQPFYLEGAGLRHTPRGLMVDYSTQATLFLCDIPFETDLEIKLRSGTLDRYPSEIDPECILLLDNGEQCTPSSFTDGVHIYRAPADSGRRIKEIRVYNPMTVPVWLELFSLSKQIESGSSESIA